MPEPVNLGKSVSMSYLLTLFCLKTGKMGTYSFWHNIRKGSLRFLKLCLT